jgi:hypothetical protein
VQVIFDTEVFEATIGKKPRGYSVFWQFKAIVHLNETTSKLVPYRITGTYSDARMQVARDLRSKYKDVSTRADVIVMP